MRKFLKKTLLFITLPLTCYVCVLVVLKVRLNNKIINSQAIILGDSHTDHLRMPNVFNYSTQGAPYIMHYNFLKNFEDPIKNKKVILAFGYHNVSSLYENRFKENVVRQGWLPMVNREINSVNFIDETYDYEWKKGNVFENFFAKSRFTRLFHLNYPKPGMNTAKWSNDTVSFSRTIVKHYTNPDFIAADTIQQKYLNQIIELLEKQNCEIYLLNTPTSDYYSRNIPYDIKNEFHGLINKYQKAKYIDLNSLLKNKIDSTIFKDADHVNQNGDKLVEKYIETYILE